MSKILTVFGATGQQGNSIISHVLEDPELSKQYKLRAITRDPSSKSSQILKGKGVEIVQADTSDPSTLRAAMDGSYTVYLMTTSIYTADNKDVELSQGKAAVDAAVAAGVSYLIFSTLPSVIHLTKGKYTKVISFDEKADVEQYIRSLPIKSAFFAPGCFMQNFQTMMAPRPDHDDPDSYTIHLHVNPSTRLPLIDIAGDTGKYVGAILANPDKYEGKTLCSASAIYTIDQIAETIGKVTSKKVRYQQIPEEKFRHFLPPYAADPLIEMMLYQQDFGYYGERTDELVAWAVENARGEVTSFEEFLKKNPTYLD